MPQERPKPDLALLANGWERNSETDQYRQSADAPWLSHDAARVMAFGPPETEEKAVDLRRDINRTLGFIEACEQLAERYGFRSAGYSWNATQTDTVEPVLNLYYVITKDPLI